MAEPRTSTEANIVTPTENIPPTPAIGLAKKTTGSFADSIHTFLNEHFFLLNTLSWPMQAVPSTLIYSQAITPLQAPTMVSHLAALYNCWTGGAHFSIAISGNAFQAGKLGMVWLPPNRDPTKGPLTLTALTSYPHVIIDVRHSTDATIYCGDQNDRIFHYLNNTADVGGYFALFVTNQLISSGTTQGSVDVNISFRSDFDFYEPVPPMLITPEMKEIPIELKYGVTSLGVGYYGSMNILPSTYANAAHYLDGVRQGDGSFYKNFQIYQSSEQCAVSPEKYEVKPRSNRLFRLKAWGQNQQIKLNQDQDKSITIYNFRMVEDNYLYEGTVVGVTRDLNLNMPLPGQCDGVTSYEYSSHDYFVPKGRTPESFLVAGLVKGLAKPLTEIPTMQHFPIWNAIGKTGLNPGRAFIGEVFDAKTNSPICNFKIYFEGFITTNAHSAHQTIADSVVFIITSEVPETYALPPTTAAQATYLQLNDCGRKARQILKKAKWQQQQQELFSDLEVESSPMLLGMSTRTHDREWTKISSKRC